MKTQERDNLVSEGAHSVTQTGPAPGRVKISLRTGSYSYATLKKELSDILYYVQDSSKKGEEIITIKAEGDWIEFHLQ